MVDPPLYSQQKPLCICKLLLTFSETSGCKAYRTVLLQQHSDSGGWPGIHLHGELLLKVGCRQSGRAQEVVHGTVDDGRMPLSPQHPFSAEQLDDGCHQVIVCWNVVLEVLEKSMEALQLLEGPRCRVRCQSLQLFRVGREPPLPHKVT